MTRSQPATGACANSSHVPSGSFLVFRSFSRYYVLSADCDGILTSLAGRGYDQRVAAEVEAILAMTDGKALKWTCPDCYANTTLKRYYARRDGIAYRSTHDNVGDSVLIERRLLHPGERFEPRIEEPHWPDPQPNQPSPWPAADRPAGDANNNRTNDNCTTLASSSNRETQPQPAFDIKFHLSRSLASVWSDEQIGEMLKLADRQKGKYDGMPFSLWWSTFLLVALETNECLNYVLHLCWWQVGWKTGFIYVPSPHRVDALLRPDVRYYLTSDARKKLRQLSKYATRDRNDDVKTTEKIFDSLFHVFFKDSAYQSFLVAAGLLESPDDKPSSWLALSGTSNADPPVTAPVEPSATSSDPAKAEG